MPRKPKTGDRIDTLESQMETVTSTLEALALHVTPRSPTT